MQFINNIFLSLSLNAKGYKNYGSFNKTGEKKFIKNISNDLFFCIDIGANIGKYTELLLKETNAKIVSFEPLNEAFQDLKKIELKNPNRLKVFNNAIGEKNETLELNYSNNKSEKASFTEHLDKLSFYEFNADSSSVTQLQILDVATLIFAFIYIYIYNFAS